jgi:hypothetical protein
MLQELQARPAIEEDQLFVVAVGFQSSEPETAPVAVEATVWVEVPPTPTDEEKVVEVGWLPWVDVLALEQEGFTIEIVEDDRVVRLACPYGS